MSLRYNKLLVRYINLNYISRFELKLKILNAAYSIYLNYWQISVLETNFWAKKLICQNLV